MRIVMKAKKQLKGTNMFINDDLTPSQRQFRRKLWQRCTKIRSEGKRAFVSGDRLFIDGKEYISDDASRAGSQDGIDDVLQTGVSQPLNVSSISNYVINNNDNNDSDGNDL